MRKLLFVLITMLLLLAACGENEDTSADNDNAGNDTEQEEDPNEDESNQESGNNQNESPDVAEEKSAAAETFLDKMVNEQFAEAYNDMNKLMQAEITEEQLTEIWNTVTSEIGSFVSYELVSATQEQGNDIFIYDGLFAGGNAQFNVAVDSANEIIGFYIYPK